MHTSVGRTVYPVYKLQQHVSTHSRGGREQGRGKGAGQAGPLYNYFRLLQTNPASKTAAPAAVAAAVTTMARTMTGLTARIRNVGTGILLSWQPHRIRIHIRIETFRAQMSLTPSH